MNIITKAKQFASDVHKHQVRNDEAKTPYVIHLAEVAELVRDSGGSDEEIAAAWLHDAVEDTEATMEEIIEEFGDEVGNIVEAVTDLTEWLPLTLAERKAKQAERVAKESDSVKRVKLADQTSNVKIVGDSDLTWGRDVDLIYINSARKIAEVCKGVSPYLDKLFEERYEETLQKLNS
jgi:guanosine-3',5'-bis(diphosphate) 3'-pyrophosphohydrolase